MILNKEELGRYGVIALAYWYFLGWWTLLVVPACAFLGASPWRRIGVPLALCLPLWIIHGDWNFLLSAAAIYGLLCVGYGIPTFTNDSSADDGSALGRFAWSIAIRFGGTREEIERLASIITHSIIVAGINASLFPLALINFPVYLGASIVAILWVIGVTVGIKGEIKL